MGLAPGQLLGKRFTLGSLLARGAMGEVWSAQDRDTVAEVAVKTLRDSALSMPNVTQRFEREADVLSRIKNPHVAELVATVQTDGRLHIVIERLVG